MWRWDFFSRAGWSALTLAGVLMLGGCESNPGGSSEVALVAPEEDFNLQQARTQLCAKDSRFDGQYRLTFWSEGSPSALALFELRDSQFSGALTNIFDERFEAQGCVGPEGLIWLEPLQGTRGSLVLAEGRVTPEGILEGEFQVGERRGSFAGQRQNAEAKVSLDFEGDYRLRFFRHNQELASQTITVAQGRFASTLANTQGLQAEISGYVTEDGTLIFQELRTSSALKILAEGRIDQEFFTVSGIYQIGESIGTVQGERLTPSQPSARQGLLAATLTASEKIEEFDQGFGAWTYSPQNMGVGTPAGWQITASAGERAAFNTPTTTKSTYYWKLSRTFPLSGWVQPQLRLRFDFRKSSYESFMILASFSNGSTTTSKTLYELRTSSNGLQSLTLDLKEYLGKTLTLELQLKKPLNVSEPTAGLYLYSLGLQEASALASASAAPLSRSETLFQQLLQYNQGISSALRKSKYDNMSVSPFTFYRGTAHLYYEDLFRQNWLAQSPFFSAQASTWIQGDLHVANYGAYDDDTGLIIYDLNDFDESWVTSYLYDVWRAAISLVLVARENGGFSESEIRAVLDSFSETYLDTLETYRNNDNEKSFKLSEQNAYGLLDEFLAETKADNSRVKMLDKWTIKNGSKRTFNLANPDLGAVTTTQRNALLTALQSYPASLTSSLKGNTSYFKVKDVALRLNAGTGSLGTPRYYVLIEGKTSDADNDRLLDVKEQTLPSVYPYLSAHEQQVLLGQWGATQMGCRVAAAQKALLTNVDNHLGCLTLSGKSYSVRERSPYKETFDTTTLETFTQLSKLAEQWGLILASDHARADKTANATLVPSNLEDLLYQLAEGRHEAFRAEVQSRALSYAAQVATDYQLFRQLRTSGRIE